MTVPAHTALVGAHAAAAGGFSPDDISGLVGWYKADSLSLNDGDAVSTWANSSAGAAADLTGAGGARPLYKTNILNGKPVLRFDSTNDTMVSGPSGFLLSQPNTVIVVTDTCRPWESLNSEPNRQLFGINGGRWAFYAGSSVIDTGQAMSVGTFKAGVCIFNGASSKAWIGGGTATTGNPGTGNMTQVNVNFDGGNNWGGDLAEMFAYDTALSLVDINSIGTYLNAEYGVTWSTAT